MLLINDNIRVLTMSVAAIAGSALFAGCDGTEVEPDAPPEPIGLAARWLAFDSDRGTFNRDLYLVRGDGSDVTRLTSESSTEKDPRSLTTAPRSRLPPTARGRCRSMSWTSPLARSSS